MILIPALAGVFMITSASVRTLCVCHVPLSILLGLSQLTRTQLSPIIPYTAGAAGVNTADCVPNADPVNPTVCPVVPGTSVCTLEVNEISCGPDGKYHAV